MKFPPGPVTSRPRGLSACAEFIECHTVLLHASAKDEACACKQAFFKLTSAGEALLSHNSVNHLLGVTVTVKDNDGQTLQFVVHLAKWFWHS